MEFSKQDINDTLENAEDEFLQGDEDIMENGRRDNNDKENEAVAFEAFISAGEFVWQKISEDMGAVERRNWQHIEDREVDIINNNEVEDDEQPFGQREIQFRH